MQHLRKLKPEFFSQKKRKKTLNGNKIVNFLNNLVKKPIFEPWVKKKYFRAFLECSYFFLINEIFFLLPFSRPPIFSPLRVCLAVMSQFLVRPALFDLYLASVIGLYLTGLYFGILHFNEIIAAVTPVLAKPDLIKKQKALWKL